jgi:hypothetical protein
MKSATLAGIVLIVLGIISFAYQGITYTTRKNVLDVGPIHATKDEHTTIPIPPIVGAIALIGGVVLVFAGGKSAA